ncbi:MAG: IPTL-CTERM sorting domain-containing protein, partial [Acidobacteria bacterium]|nr:IPTL-CTERM sorting domain-containing protein [Acidobacteriota bacterium]
HSRPPTAQVFDVIDPANPAFGQRFTAVAVHFKSKGCSGATGLDLDQNDGQGCYNARRTAQATRLNDWLGTTVLPAAGDPDLLLLGDFNFYALEDPAGVLAGAGYVDLAALFGGPNVYSYLFDGQLGRFDYAWASASLAADSVGAGVWHVDADEVPLFDYNDEVRDPSEASFEEEPDGSALVPPRVLHEAASPFRASDHDPVLAGLFRVADLSVVKSDAPDPVIAGTNLVYTVTVANAGPDAAANVSWSDTLPTGATFELLSAAPGWSCTTPAVGAGGTVTCSIASLPITSAVFALTVQVSPAVAAGTVLSNTATATSPTSDPDLDDRTSTTTTTVNASANVSLLKGASPVPAIAGQDLTYTLTAVNAGPSFAAGVSVSDPLPAGTTFVSLSAPGGWSCTTPAVGSGGTVTCGIASFGIGSAVFTLVVRVDPFFSPATPLVNVASLLSATPDPAPGDTVATSSIAVLAPASVTATKSVAGTYIPGSLVTYTVVLSNAGPAAQLDNPGDEFVDALPVGLTLVSASADSGVAFADLGTNSATWNGSIAPGGTVTIVIEATIDYGVADGTVISNQGVAQFDANGDGTNEATAPTDDPATGTPDDPTEFVVSATAIQEIPTLDTVGLALLALLLAGFAAVRLRRAPR